MKECLYTLARMATSKIQLRMKKMNLIELYGPANCNPENERSHFYEELQQTVEEIARSEIIWILGDMKESVTG